MVLLIGIPTSILKIVSVLGGMMISHSHIEEENLLMKPSWGNFPFLKFLNWHNTFILLPILLSQVLIFSKTTYKIQWHFQKCKNFENCTTRTKTMKKVLSIGHRNWFYVISIPMRNWIYVMSIPMRNWFYYFQFLIGIDFGIFP